MVSDTKKLKYFENLTSVSRELCFSVKNLRNKIKMCGILSVWSLLIMFSTVYTDGVNTLVFKIVMTFFVVAFLCFSYFLNQYFLRMQEFNVSLKKLKDEGKDIHVYFDNLAHSRY